MARRARIVVEDETEGHSDQNGAEAANIDVEEGTTDTAVADRVDEPAGETGSEPAGFTVVDRSSEPSFSTIEVIEAPTKRGRQTGAGSRPRVPKATPAAVATVAPPLIVGLMNQAVVAWAGPECAMLQVEANFLTPSIARIIGRLPPAAAQAVSVYTDPFVVIGTMALWAARIAKVKETQAKQKYQVEPFEAARAYGESGTTFTADQPAHTEPPIANTANAEPRQNGAADAILRTVSPT